LGLAITRQYVELMGGEVSVESEPGQGSVFRFEIPVQTAPAEELERVKLSRLPVIGLEPGQPVCRILIVEDQPENRLLLKKLLESVGPSTGPGQGFEVREATNGEEAIAAFEEWNPHFIWMDRRMPVMDGLEATRRIRAMEGGKETIIVALTASAFKEQREEVLAAGLDDFVRKPFREHEIFEMLHKHLGIRFVYAEEPETSPEVDKSVLAFDRLQALPEEWLVALQDAAEDLNPRAANEVINQIREQDEPLAKALSGLVKTYRFDTLQALFEETEV
jgi:CheY-like chemotaxis protein